MEVSNSPVLNSPDSWKLCFLESLGWVLAPVSHHISLYTITPGHAPPPQQKNKNKKKKNTVSFYGTESEAKSRQETQSRVAFHS